MRHIIAKDHCKLHLIDLVELVVDKRIVVVAAEFVVETIQVMIHKLLMVN